MIDLHSTVSKLTSRGVAERATELTQKVPGAHLCAVGGFPLTTRTSGEELFWCGGKVEASTLQDRLRNALGVSAVMTYMNRSEMSLAQLGDLCVRRGHDWAYHWVTASVALVGFDPKVEQAFLRDRRFWTSWVVGIDAGPFVATASVHAWTKFLSHREDRDFDHATREAMKATFEELRIILPDPIQLHEMIQVEPLRQLLSRLPLDGRRVIEIGAGTGAVTRLILEQPVDRVLAIEKVSGLCRIEDPRLTLLEADVRHVTFTDDWVLDNHDLDMDHVCLISAPPYSLLTWIQERMRHHDAVLVAPEPLEGFRVAAKLDGRSFCPRAKGDHYLLWRGFE